MRRAINKNVASVIKVTKLFRSYDYACRLVFTYMRAIESKVIRVALSDPIRQINKLKIADLELNQHMKEYLRNEA